MSSCVIDIEVSEPSSLWFEVRIIIRKWPHVDLRSIVPVIKDSAYNLRGEAADCL
jgi:hypothetical protein